MSHLYNQPGQASGRYGPPSASGSNPSYGQPPASNPVSGAPPGSSYGPPGNPYGPPGNATIPTSQTQFSQPPNSAMMYPSPQYGATAPGGALGGGPGTTVPSGYSAPGNYSAPGQPRPSAPTTFSTPPPGSGANYGLSGPPGYQQPSSNAINYSPQQFAPPAGGNYQTGPPIAPPSSTLPPSASAAAPASVASGVRPPPKSNVQFFSVAGGNSTPVPTPSAPFGGMPPPPSASGPPNFSAPPPVSGPPTEIQPPPSPGGQQFQSYPPPPGQAQFAAPPMAPGSGPGGFPSQDPNAFGVQQNTMAGMPLGFDSGSYGQPQQQQQQQQQGVPIDPSGANTPQILPGIEEMDLSIQCDPLFLRSSVGKIINSQALASQSRLPLGIVCRPMAGDIGNDNEQVEVVDFGSTGIVRCKRCRTYINPFVSWVDNGRRWRCNICGMLNDVPTSYFSHLDQSGQRRDKEQRPELSRCSVEFVAPGDYMVRPPQPPVYFFVIDVTSSASSSGMLKSCVNAIKKSLDSLPGTPRTQIGFITFDSSIHFYNLKSSLKAPQMLVVSDIADLIMPSPEDLLVNLTESRDIIEALLDSLVSMFQNSSQLNSCTGPALMAAKRVIQNIGGKLILFQTALPTIGDGILKQRENPRLLGTDKEHHLLNSEDMWYKNNAMEFSRLQICCDVFLFSNQYTDVATFSTLAKYTSGSTYYYPGFYSPRDGPKFEAELYHTLTRATAFEAVMRVRATKGLRISNFYGNFFIRGADLLALPNCHSDSVYAMDLSYDDPILNATAITVQAALLYTNSNGERRIRVHTMVIPVTQSLPEMLASTDIDCAVNITAKQAIEISLKSGLENSRQRIHQNCVEILRSSKSQPVGHYGQPGTGPGYQQRPEAQASQPPQALQLLPLYSMSLQKNLTLRGGADVRTDERSFYQNLLSNMDIEESKVFIYPRMFSIHDMPLDAGTPYDSAAQEEIPTAGANKIRLPAILNLCHERLTSEGLFLLENGYDLYLWIGRNVSPSILETLFGVHSLDGVDMSQVYIHSENSDYSYRLHNIIAALRTERSRYLQLHFIKEGDGYAEAYFSRFLVEDRTNFTGGTFSYVEYYSFVSRQVSGLPG